MADIALEICGGKYDIAFTSPPCVQDVSDLCKADKLAQPSYETLPSLYTAVLLSLFTDARDPITKRRGYWAERINNDNDYGSLLWLLERAQLYRQTLNTAEDYARGALQWMVIDGLTDEINVVAEQDGVDGILLLITLTRAGVINRFKATGYGELVRIENE